MDFIHTLFYEHRDFNYPPSPDWFWGSLFDLSLRGFENREKKGIFLRRKDYERVFNSPLVEKEFNSVIENRHSILSRNEKPPSFPKHGFD